VQVEVVRPEDSARDFLAKVKAAGGYLQQQAGGVLTVRLPAGEFDAMFTAVKAMGRVLAEQRQADDVTEEFVDLGIRIDNARKARDRLLEILQKAEKVEDILKVEAEVRRLTDEIERMEGRKKFLTDQVAMATLQVTFVPKTEAPPPPKRSRQLSPFDWINETGPETLLEGR
jgi:seryl-tRNA synthetase